MSKSYRRWSSEEIAWARECRISGDSIGEIAEAANCSDLEVIANIGPEKLTPLQREVLSFYVAGTKYKDIDLETGRTGCCSLGKASASMITSLRRRGFHIPTRQCAGEARHVD